MNILIVANNPKNVGGVMNYTRPLAQQFVLMGHTVNYLYSGTWDYSYDLRLKAYLKQHTGYIYECSEIFNSEILSYNYGFPELDVHSKQIETIFENYLDKIKPDVMHIHSRVGFPASINEIAKNKNIVVCNTIHTYGYICQKRVMIDYEGSPCLGPSDLRKCSFCTGTLDYRKERILVVLRNYNKKFKVKLPCVFNFLQRIRGNVNSVKMPSHRIEGRSYQPSPKPLPQLAERLELRLKYCIDTLNHCSDRTICVSNDVKATLMNFGVHERRLLVQHIGSVIAEKQVTNNQPLRNPIVVGNIGGVNHYKGIHVLVEAVSKVKNANFIVKIFGKYDEGYVHKLKERFSNLPIEFTGRYRPEDLPGILGQIDVMVLPSICNDTAPQTIFESFSGGVPIIASNIGGFPDFVQHDQNGLLFEAGNSDDLAEKIDYVLSDPERLIAYKRNIPKLKTITENAHELISLYSELLETRERSNNDAKGQPLKQGEF